MLVEVFCRQDVCEMARKLREAALRVIHNIIALLELVKVSQR